MQNVINSVKGTALGVAEYLTPVLKVRYRLIFKAPPSKIRNETGIQVPRDRGAHARGVRGGRGPPRAPLPDMAVGRRRRVESQTVPAQEQTVLNH